jgi:thiamine-monophosphate kinase
VAEPGAIDPEAAALQAARTVGDVGEDALVADLISLQPGADWLVVGAGDDAAVLDLGRQFPGPLVVCTDTLVEGYDFRRDWSTAMDVGVKTAAQNFADVAAMGGRPHALLVSLATPAEVPAGWALELAAGVARECARAGAVVVGGDLSAGGELVITGTAIGTLAGPRAIVRSGARPGDVVAIAGPIGRSAAGWALLRRGFGYPAVQLTRASSDPRLPRVISTLIDDHRRPRPPYPAGPEALLAGATAMIDTSDGLLRDAERLARASGVVLDLDSAALQPDSDLLLVADVLGEPDPTGWVLTGGEDHALLACFPPTAELPRSFRRIGMVRPGPSGAANSAPGGPAAVGSRVADSAAEGSVRSSGGDVLVDGTPFSGPGGWQHFA